MAKIPINIATGSLQATEMIVGIDLGTTNSLVAIIHPESKVPIALKEHDSSSLVPSIIHFGKDKQILVGNSAKIFLQKDPANTIFSVKRLIGKTFKEIEKTSNNIGYKIIDSEDNLVKIKVGDTFYTPVELQSLILKELKNNAEHILKTPISKAVITVPAYFNDAQRQATRDAGKLAGLDVLRILNEPTAASLAYGFGVHIDETKTIAVYDLGGGTFDISILAIQNGIFEVLSTNGDTFLGGDDMDNALVNFWMSHQKKSKKINAQQLRIIAEEAKKHLSNHNDFSIILEDEIFNISKKEFEIIIKPIIDKTLICCTQALKDAGLLINEIDEVVLVGGSTRVPFVKKMISDFFGKPVNEQVNPDEVVALGAAIQADILAGNTKNILLLDVTPLSLGIETMGGLMEVMIPRNSKIPTKASKQYTTYKDGQTGMIISVYQGERDLVNDNRKLAEFILKGIPNMPAGLPKVEVNFLINADGILLVTAKELRSGIVQTIEVKPQLNLTDNEVENMLLDAMTNAKTDIDKRALIEAETEAMQLLQTTEKFVQKNISLLTQTEIIQTSEVMQALQLALSLKDKNLIQNKIESLKKISTPFAERIMDTAIGEKMKGTKL